MSLEYLPVVLESIKPDAFPPVALYLQQGRQFVLYKDQGVEMSASTLANLTNGKTSHVFVRTQDFSSLHSYFEKNLARMFTTDTISPESKNLVFCSAMVTYISDLYQNPQRTSPYQNCRTLLSNFHLDISEGDELLNLMESVSKCGIYLFTHCAQVAILSMRLYRLLFDSKQQETAEIGLGAMLHDIGMLNVSHNIVGKCDALDENEYHRIREHVREGHSIAVGKGIHESKSLDIILRHHERYDGRGYPGCLRDEAIPFGAQVVGICDVFSALVNDRPYRPASTYQEALATMRSESALFNPLFLSRFEEMIGN